MQADGLYERTCSLLLISVVRIAGFESRGFGYERGLAIVVLYRDRHCKVGGRVRMGAG